MKLHQSDGFAAGPKGRADRRAAGVPDGEPLELAGAFHRWYCPDCSSEWHRRDWTYTRLRDNPRLYAWLPWSGPHWRVGLRQALYHRRNASESLNACVQAWGLGLKGKAGPFWCNHTYDIYWFSSCVMAAQTLRRLAQMRRAPTRRASNRPAGSGS